MARLAGDTMEDLIRGHYAIAGFALFIFCLLFFVPAFAGENSEILRLLSSGDSLYNISDYHGSAEYFSEAGKIDSSNFDAFWKLSRSLNYEGETVPKDSQLAVFERARDAADRAIKLNDRSADAHFQLARALGKIALFKGVFKSASLAKQVRSQVETALALDSLHDGAWHIYGRWNRELTKKPKILRSPMGLGSANKEDAIAFMRRAIEINPTYINHHLEMGITYEQYGNNKMATQEYQKCLDLPAERPLDNIYKEEARKHLAKIGKD